MKNSKLNMFGDMGIVPENGGKVKSFDRAKRDFETAFCNGADYSAELLDLATAIAFSVINKCIDPTRKFAPTREQTSHSGLNPAMLDVKRDIAHDMALLENTRRNVEKATATAYNDEGDTYTAIVDKDAFTAVSDLIGECLGEGIDLVQEAALALIEQAAEHANGEKWLDTPYTVRRLSKRVYIKTTDSAAYRDEETTPIREAYRAVRRHIMSSRAVQTDPRNGYVYIDAMTPDGLETMFYRMGKWEDIGSYDSMGNYTAGIETAQTYESIVEKLNLTDRQAMETGHYLPDIEMMQLLCKEFGISINELISGERIESSDYKEKAEENLIAALGNSSFTLKEKIAFFKKKWLKEHIMDIVLSVIAWAVVIVALKLQNVEGYLIGTVSSLLGIFFYIVRYNQMMIYVEDRVYNKTEK